MLKTKNARQATTRSFFRPTMIVCACALSLTICGCGKGTSEAKPIEIISDAVEETMTLGHPESTMSEGAVLEVTGGDVSEPHYDPAFVAGSPVVTDNSIGSYDYSDDAQNFTDCEDYEENETVTCSGMTDDLESYGDQESHEEQPTDAYDEEDDPIAPMTEEEVLSFQSSLISKAGSGHTGTNIGDLYKRDCPAEVLSCQTDGTHTVADVRIYGRTGVCKYEGDLHADFEWDDGEWTLVSCETGDDTFEPRIDWMEGAWTGRFESTRTDYRGTPACYGGSVSPATLVVTEADPVSMTMTCDLTFLAHNHLADDNCLETTEGDEETTLSGILVPVKRLPCYAVTAYKEEGPIDDCGGKYEVTFTYMDDGTINAVIRYTWMEDMENMCGHSDTYIDTFVLEKVA